MIDVFFHTKWAKRIIVVALFKNIKAFITTKITVTTFPALVGNPLIEGFNKRRQLVNEVIPTMDDKNQNQTRLQFVTAQESHSAFQVRVP